MTGVELIARERAEHLAREGYDARHDDTHTEGELAIAGALYALNSCGEAPPPIEHWGYAPKGWPWRSEDWKPKTRLRDLARAGALIAAEIDRLVRCGEKE